jgi:signal peptidase I
VVVFTVARDGPAIFPADQRPDLRREEFVKRIVATPGDTVEVTADAVRVNGEVVHQTRLDRPFDDEAGRTLGMRTEQVGDHRYTVLDDPLLPGLLQRPFRVPEGRYFMMGDNRDHSNDSRNWGTVKLAEIKGPAFVLYWSWDWDGSWAELINPLTWVHLLTQETRWSRIGDRID